MSDIEHEVRQTVAVCEKVAGVAATRTHAMLRTHGAVETLSRLMVSGDFQAGFRALVAAGRHEDSFEAIVPRNARAFRRDVVAAARWRLDQALGGMP